MGVIVEFLDVRIEPDILSFYGADALASQGDLLYDVLADQVASGRFALDGKGGEVVLETGLLELRTRAQLHADGLGLPVVVGGEPDYLGARLAGGDVVLLVARHGCDGEALGVVDRCLALAVDDIVDGTVVTAVEDVDIQEVLAEEGLVLHLGDAVFSVLADDDHLGEVGTVADVFAPVVFLETDAHEAFREVGLETCVVVDHLGGGDGLESGEFGAAREVLAVFFLESCEPVDGVAVDVVDVFLH